MSAAQPSTDVYVGGQAVIEGVMMRAARSSAVVCRRADGTLIVREEPYARPTGGMRTMRFVRGILALPDALRTGSRALRWSVALYERDAPADAGGSALLATHLTLVSLFTRADADVTSEPEGRPLFPPVRDVTPRPGAQLLPLVMLTLLLVALPQGIAELIVWLAGLPWDVTSLPYQLLTGALQVAVLATYMRVLRGIPEIFRVFQYHGAEHMAVAAHEKGLPLEVAPARSMTTLHARCGTTFLVTVVMMSIVAFALVGALFPSVPGSELLGGGRFGQGLLFFFMKLPLLPVVAGLTFELQRLFAGVDPDGPLGFLLWPGFRLQRITTASPELPQLEVALAALRAAKWRDENPDAPVPPDRVFTSFEALAADPGYVGRAD